MTATGQPPVAIPTPTLTPTPTVSPISAVYTSEEYWYTIEVPSGWQIDSSESDFITIWEPNTGSVVFVTVLEIDPLVHPTLDSYVDSWDPAPAENWANFRIDSQTRIFTGLPLQAHEFEVRFEIDGERHKGVIDWYVIGRYQITVQARAEARIWTFSENREVRQAMERALYSFEPASYVSSEHGYSIAHPTSWIRVVDESFDYWAYDPSGTAQVWVEFIPDTGYTSVFDYGTSNDIVDSLVLSRGQVFPERPNPSYRINYFYVPPSHGNQKGAALINLKAGDAVWVWVQADEDEWPQLEGLVDEILLRVAVMP